MMKRLVLAALAILVLSTLAFPDASAQQRYGWVVSGSSSNPCAYTGNFSPGGIATVYLWFVYGNPQGMSAADLSVVINPAGAVNVLAFNTANGFLNAGSATNLLLAVGGCPDDDVVAGSWLCLPTAPAWEFCLGGNRLTVDCQINPVAWDSDTHGFTNGGAPSTCVNGMTDDCIPGNCFGWSCDPVTKECVYGPCGCELGCYDETICETCGTVSVESSSWGKVKTLYR